MDVIQNYDKIEDLNIDRFGAYIQDVSKIYSDDLFDYIVKHIKYKKSTIAFFHHLLNYHQVENGLDQYISKLSKYKIPNVEVLYEASRK